MFAKIRYAGKFIVLEGLDGSGQTTQVELLNDFLEQKGHSVILTKEPTTDSESGRIIRKVLDKEIIMEPGELQKHYIQDRKEHLQNLIIPSLKEGKTVISDRYFFSTFAFGGINLDMDWLISLNKEFIFPDIAIFLDVLPEVCIQRINKRGEGFKFFEKLEKLKKVRRNYVILIERFLNFFAVDGELSPDRVFTRIKNILKKNCII